MLPASPTGHIEYAVVVTFNWHHNKDYTFQKISLQMSRPSSKALKDSQSLKAILAVNTWEWLLDYLAPSLSGSTSACAAGDNRCGEMAPEVFELYFSHPYVLGVSCPWPVYPDSILSSKQTAISELITICSSIMFIPLARSIWMQGYYAMEMFLYMQFN